MTKLIMFEDKQYYYTAFPVGQYDTETGMALKLTGESIHTVTSRVDIAKNNSGEVYYTKPTSDKGGEFKQLLLLQSFGLPVPQDIRTNWIGTSLATVDSGVSLSSLINSDPDQQMALAHRAGQLLAEVHTKLAGLPLQNGAIKRSFMTTAHIVDDFFYKHIKLVSDDEYKKNMEDQVEERIIMDSAVVKDLVTKTPFIPHPKEGSIFYKSTIGLSNEVANVLLEKASKPAVRRVDDLTQIPYLPITERQLMYGDFKPENILVQQGELVLIDPFIAEGAQVFDVAKFTGRLKLEGQQVTDVLLDPFYEGYGQVPQDGDLAYQSLTFDDLVKMDILNILRSYAKRYAAGNKNYRLVNQLDDPNFCARICTILSS